MRAVDRYRAFLLDLDGVVYRGQEAVPGAAEAVAGLRDAGRRVVFITNNSARTPEQVADRLDGLGVAARPEEVVTSAQATATLVAREDGERTAFVIGEEGVRHALRDAGIEVLDGVPRSAGFVVVGWDRAVDYEKLRVATVLVGRGARLVATNEDASYPAPGGELWPGAGSLLAAVETASGVRATVVGKPHRALFDAAVERAGTDRVLVVGDRIETDVAGAVAAGLDAALVLTGTAGPHDLLNHDALPVAVLPDLSAIDVDRRWPRVRPAAEEDRDQVRKLLQDSGLVPGATGTDGAVVAEEGTVVGTAAADVSGDEAYLHSVAVDRGARGAGLGSLCVAAAVRRAAALGARRVFLLTEDADGFFSRLGFQALERGRLPSWAAEQGTHCSTGATAMVRDVVRARHQ